ncbi:MAG: hypothetical protein GY765_39380, partial [bacterium]|nr:hypothetical protein [bacterium]
MLRYIWMIFCIVSMVCFLGAQDSEDSKFSVDIVQEGRVDTHAFFIEELLEMKDGAPIVRATFGKVRMEDGKFVKRLFVPLKERGQHKYILADYSKYRMYIAIGSPGIFTYEPVKRPKKAKKGFYFQALPVDRDATLKRITKSVTEKASLESLLDMDLEDAMKTADKETVLTSALDKFVDAEVKALEKVKKKKKK